MVSHINWTPNASRVRPEADCPAVPHPDLAVLHQLPSHYDIQAQIHSRPTYVPSHTWKVEANPSHMSLSWPFQLTRLKALHEATDRACSLVTRDNHLVPLPTLLPTAHQVMTRTSHSPHSPLSVESVFDPSLLCPLHCASLGISLSLSLSLSLTHTHTHTLPKCPMY